MGLRIAKIPYLNAEPFYAGLSATEFSLLEIPPRRLGELARAGEIEAGLMPVVDFFALEKHFVPLADLGIAVRGAVKSVVLFSKVPREKLSGRKIGITPETSTSYRLLQLLCRGFWRVAPSAFIRDAAAISSEADVYLWIGNEVLRRNHGRSPEFPYQYDLALEWWRWQQKPFVFALWAIHRKVTTLERTRLAQVLEGSLDETSGQFEKVAQRLSGVLGTTAELTEYLSNFTYRLGRDEWQGLETFRRLLDEFRIA